MCSVTDSTAPVSRESGEGAAKGGGWGEKGCTSGYKVYCVSSLGVVPFSPGPQSLTVKEQYCAISSDCSATGICHRRGPAQPRCVCTFEDGYSFSLSECLLLETETLFQINHETVFPSLVTHHISQWTYRMVC